MNSTTKNWIIGILVVAIIIILVSRNHQTTPAIQTNSPTQPITQQTKKAQKSTNITQKTIQKTTATPATKQTPTTETTNLKTTTTPSALVVSYTNKAYGYSIQIPKTWYWNQMNVPVLTLSASKITTVEEPLTNDNMKIIRADQPIPSNNVVVINLGISGGASFKAIYLKSNKHTQTIQTIIKSFIPKK